MPSNTHSIEVPTWFTPVLSDTAQSVAGDGRGCRGFDIWAAGDVKWTDIENYTQTRTMASPFPIRVTGKILRIWATGTTVGVADIAGLR